MKTWMLVAIAALHTSPVCAELGAGSRNPVTSGARIAPAPLPSAIDEAARAEFIKELEATRTALLPQAEPLPQVTVKHQPKLNEVKAAAGAAKAAAELEKAKKDFTAWKAVVLRELHVADQKMMPTGETLTAYSTRRAREVSFVMTVRQEFVAQRAQTQVEAVRAVGYGSGPSEQNWNGVFDNGVLRAPSSLSTPSIPLSTVDGAVRAERLTGDAKYAKLRNIAVKSWGASPRIVDAAIAEAVRQNVDPALVLAVIWQESRFNTHATSPVGARGLMQVMPDTGRGLGVSNPDMLYDMKTNLRAGVKYLRNAVSYLKLDMDLSDISDAAPNKIKALLASYNAGCGAVSKWLRQQGSDLVRIPYAETRHYVRVIGAKLNSLGAALGW